MVRYNYANNGTPPSNTPNQDLPSVIPGLQQAPVAGQNLNNSSSAQYFVGNQLMPQAQQPIVQQPAVPATPQSVLTPEQTEYLHNLASEYINVLTCKALYERNFQSSGIRVDKKQGGNPDTFFYDLRHEHVPGEQNQPCDQSAVIEGAASFQQLVSGEDLSAFDVNIEVSPEGLRLNTFNAVSKQIIQSIKLPMESPRVPIIPEESDTQTEVVASSAIAPASDSVAVPIPQPKPAQAPVPLENPGEPQQYIGMPNIDTFNNYVASQPGYEATPVQQSPPPAIDPSFSLVQMANTFCQSTPIELMTIEELRIIAQTYLLTRPTGNWIPISKAAKLLTKSYGEGWTRTSLIRHIKNDYHFDWYHGLHYLGSGPTPSYINIDAVHHSMVNDKDDDEEQN